MDDRAQAGPGEIVVSPDSLTLTKRVTRRAWPYAAALVVVLAVLGIVFHHSLSWGDVPTWVLAITTLLAFLAAAFAGLVAYNLLKVETARDLKAAKEGLLAAADRKRAEDERAVQLEANRRAQASKVTAWFDRWVEDYRGDVWGAAVRNASELPILDVRVSYYWVNDPRDGSPWTTEQRYASVDRIRMIPPGKTEYHELPERVISMAEECSTQVYLVGIEFTDANGIGWRRDERGALHGGRTGP
jgi:hypothetical protein